LVKIDDTHFILAYASEGYDGFIKTFSVEVPFGPTDLKSINGVAIADIKSINGVAIADIKSINGIT